MNNNLHVEFHNKNNVKKNTPNKADLMTYRAFQTALKKNELNIYINDRILNKPGIEVYNPWEILLPKLIPVIIGLFLLYINVFLGLVVVLGSIGIGERLFRKKNNAKLFERTKNYILESYDNLEEMWQIGSIIMSSEGKKSKSCISPKNDWKEFIINNYSKYMVKEADVKEEDKIKNAEESIKEEKPSLIQPFTHRKTNKNV